MRYYLLFFFSLILFSLQAQTRKKKVVFVIADGISLEMLKSVATPNLKKIASEGSFLNAYVGGEKNSYSQTPTISAVGYNSLLTGTWVNKHNVWDNDIKEPNYHYPTIFRLLKDQFPEKEIAVFSSWMDNRTKLVGDGLMQTGKIEVDYKADGYELDTVNFPHDANRDFMHKIDQEVIKQASKTIKTHAPDLSWVYLEYTDDMGHMYGKSPQMDTAIKYLDKQIGQLLEAVSYREKQFNEDWMVAITTDHGRDAEKGRDHGGQTESERNTWIITNVEANEYGRQNQVGIVDLMPTIATYMGITLPENIAKEIDGVSFLGDVSIAKPKVVYDGNSLNINWMAFENKGDVSIMLSETNNCANGETDIYQILDKVALKSKQYKKDIKLQKGKLYKIVLKAPLNTVNYWVKLN